MDTSDPLNHYSIENICLKALLSAVFEDVFLLHLEESLKAIGEKYTSANFTFKTDTYII